MLGCARFKATGCMAALLWGTGVGCLPDNPAPLDGGSDGTPSDDGGTGSVGGGQVLGCGGEPCTLVLVTQTLDDRIEIFAPDAPDGVVYRGAVDLDLKPNECAGCGPGDYGAGRLDEPYGVAIAGGALHVTAGHYPAPELGTLVSFPLDVFADLAVGQTLPAGAYFSGGAFLAPVLGTALGELEPIFLTRVQDRLVIGTFNNNLFSSEDAWTLPGKLIVVDPADPGGGLGVATLDDLDGGSCDGAAQVIELSPGRLAVACDGNEAVAILDTEGLAGAAPAPGAAAITGRLCSVPGVASSRRVRHLAPDGDGGFVVAEGPTPLDVLAVARLWHFDGDCQMLGVVTLPADRNWQLGQITRWPGENGRWLLASGSAVATDPRGVYVVHAAPSLAVCDRLAGMDALLVDDAGDPLQPFAIAVTADGTHAAVGVGPFMPPAAGPGFGKVLWATLQGADDPCAATAQVVDLTAAETGAPAVDPTAPKTFRRAPNVIEIVQVNG